MLILFGILIAINLQTSFLTPPMAMSAYYLKGVAPKGLELMTIFKGSFPFLVMVIVSLICVYAEPRIVTFLPEYFYSNTAEAIDNEPGLVDPSFFLDE